MHVVTLVGTDPDIVGNVIAGEVGRELTEVDDVGDASGIGLDVFVADKGIVLALVQLVAAGMIEWRGAKGIGLHVGFPRFTMGFQFVDDVGDIDGRVIVVSDPVGGTGSGSDVVGLAGVSDTVVVGCEPSGGGSEIDEGRVGVAEKRVVASIFHHDNKDVIEAGLAFVTASSLSKRRDRENQCGDDCAQECDAAAFATEISDVHRKSSS